MKLIKCSTTASKLIVNLTLAFNASHSSAGENTVSSENQTVALTELETYIGRLERSARRFYALSRMTPAERGAFEKKEAENKVAHAERAKAKLLRERAAAAKAKKAAKGGATEAAEPATPEPTEPVVASDHDEPVPGMEAAQPAELANA